MPDALRVLARTDEVDGPVAPAAVLIDKPGGLSSFGVVKKVRWATGEKRVGHAGTLDPMATGLLVVLVGRQATREQDRFMGLPKVYTGTARFGQTTPSYDAESPVEATVPAGPLTDAALAEAARRLTGEIEQVPPAYSAIKVGGERLYKKARRGEDVAPRPRRVVVTAFDWTDRRPGPDETLDVDFRIACSKGTYIRSLAHDAGQALGVGAHLVALRREAIGPFEVAEAFALDAFVEAVRAGVEP